MSSTMRFIALYVVVAVGIIPADSKGNTSGCKKRYLTSKDMKILGQTYKLSDSFVGPFQAAELWHSDTVTKGKSDATGYMLALNYGLCGIWSQWPTERYYHWQGGVATIDKIHPNGTRVSECLGSTVCDSECKFVVKIPAGWYADIRTDTSYALIAAVVVGDDTGKKGISYQYMKDNYGQQHGHIIAQTERCYSQ